MNYFLRGTGLLILLFTTLSSTKAQQDIRVDIYPHSSRAIEGQLKLNRSKYFNLSASGTGIEGKIGDQTRTDYYFKDLEMTLGRALGMVGSEVQWGNSVFEDPNRPGYTDIDLLISKQNPSNAGASPGFMNLLGDNQNVANHDRHNSYPDFMDLYTAEGSDQSYPGNTDAAAELAATLLEYKYTDWTRPAFFEPVNEPDWRYWGDSRFIEHHTSIYDKVHAANLPVEVGGPCLSVGYFYNNNYKALSQITGFMDKSQFSLDFYSYHIYNYMHWDEDLFDFAGSITTGLPTEGVFDAIANHSVNKFGKAFTYVASEHGGYIQDSKQDEVTTMLANKYFPGSGFAHTMEKRSIGDFLAVSSALANTFTYMNHPHIVKKAVPFILLESAGWDPTYYSVLLVKEDFDKNKGWWESKRIHFYEFFKDVRGRRIRSFCDDADIQHHAFVDGNRLILLFNNQSTVDGQISLNIHDDLGAFKEIKARKFGRMIDFRPYLTEERLFSLEEPLPIKGREAIVLSIEYTQTISEEQILNEIAHYGNNTSVEFSGSQDFTVEMPGFEEVKYAHLRVGIGLDPMASKQVNFSINGTPLDSDVEDCADRLSGGSSYGSTRIMKVDTSLLEASNTITVTFPDGQTGGVGATVIRAGYLSEDAIEGLEFKQKSVTLYENQTTSVPVAFFPETSNDKALTWESLDQGIATVSAEGIIKGIASGISQVVVHSVNGSFSDTCTITVNTLDLVSKADKSGWKAIYADDEGVVNGTLKELAVDDNPNTYWHTEWLTEPWKPMPHEIWVDMADTLTFDRFIYTPRQDPWGPNGNIGDYELYFSNDTSDWGTAELSGTFSWKIGEDDYYKEVQQVDLPAPVTARYFRLVALTEHQGNPEMTHSNAAELDVASDLSGILLQEDTVRISVGESTMLEVKSLPFHSLLGGGQVNWSSENLSVVSVSDGSIKGEGPGVVQIIATTFDGMHADTCVVIASVVPVDSLKISVKDLEMNVGETYLLNATIHPGNAYFDSYSWSSDNEAVAPVDLGYVSALKPGVAHIVIVSSDGDKRDSCRVTVTDNRYSIEILVLDEFTGLPLEGAMVQLGEERSETDESGISLFPDWIQGDYSLNVSKDRYENYTTTLSFPSDTSYSLQLRREEYQVDIRVGELELGIPVYNASVLVGTTEKKTDLEGMAPFALAWGDFPYSIEKPYFIPSTGTISIEGDSLVSLSLERVLADLKFRVSDSSALLQGVSILFDEELGTTNSLGVFTFKEKTLDSYAYEVSKQGYETLKDVIVLEKDSTLNLVLKLATDVNQGELGQLIAYPNPVDEFLMVHISEEVNCRLISMEGVLLKEIQLPPGDHRISMQEYESGLYLLRFVSENGISVKTITVIH